MADIRERSGANNPDRPKLWEKRRAQHLLTGKLFCTSCGGALGAVGKDSLSCAAARKRGTCTNKASIRRLYCRMEPAGRRTEQQPLMQELKSHLGAGPVYLSFDIDGLDPAFAPGTGTPEIGGLTAPQGLEIIRGLDGVDIVGGDIVEVSPPFDPFGTRAIH